MTTVGFFLFSTVMSDLLPKIEAFLEANKMSPTAFGKASVGDPCFVGDLRRGRRVWPDTADKVLAFIASRAGDGNEKAAA